MSSVKEKKHKAKGPKPQRIPVEPRAHAPTYEEDEKLYWKELYGDPSKDTPRMRVLRGRFHENSKSQYYVPPPEGFVPWWTSYLPHELQPPVGTPKNMAVSVYQVEAPVRFDPTLGYYHGPDPQVALYPALYNKWRSYKLEGYKLKESATPAQWEEITAAADPRYNLLLQVAGANIPKIKVRVPAPETTYMSQIREEAAAQKAPAKSKKGRVSAAVLPPPPTPTSVLHATVPLDVLASMEAKGVIPRMAPRVPKETRSQQERAVLRTAALEKAAQLLDNREKKRGRRPQGRPGGISDLVLTPERLPQYAKLAARLQTEELSYYYDASYSKGFTYGAVMDLAESTGKTIEAVKASLVRAPGIQEARYYKAPTAMRQVSADQIVDALKAGGVMIREREFFVTQPGTRECTEGISAPGFSEMSAFQVGGEVFPGMEVYDETVDWDSQPVIPFFYPKYTTGKVNMRFLNVAGALAEDVSLSQDDRGAFSTMLGHCFFILQNHFFGNGSVKGQVGRFTAVKRQYDLFRTYENDPSLGRFRSRREVPDTSEGRANFNRIMDKYYPLLPEGQTAIDFDWDLWPTGIVDLEREMINDPSLPQMRFTRVNVMADVGPLFCRPIDRKVQSQTKIGNVFYQTLEIADHIINLCREPDLKLLIQKTQWATIAYLKPKAEVYTQEKFETGTRNICVLNAGAALPANMVFRASHSSEGVRFDQHPTSVSMKGFSPWNNGMSNFVEYFKAAPLGTGLIYSDNLYIKLMGTDGAEYLFSTDGSKHESASTRSMVAAECARSCGVFKSMMPEMERYMRTVFPAMSVDATVVLGTQQITNPGLGSGSAGTDIMNHVKTTLFYDALQGLIEEGWDLPVLDLDVEVQTDRTWVFAEKLVGVAMKRETQVSVVDLEEKSFKYIPADCLGFGFVPTDAWGIPDGKIPLLEYSRLLKSLLYQRRPEKAGEVEGKNITLARYKMFYLIGGWYHDAVARVLTMLCSSLVDEIRVEALELPPDQRDQPVVLPDWGEEVQDLLAITALDMPPEVVRFLLERSVPTLYDIIRLSTSADGASLFVSTALREYPEIAHFLIPLEILAETAATNEIPYSVPEFAVLSDGVDHFTISAVEYLSLKNEGRELKFHIDGVEVVSLQREQPSRASAVVPEKTVIKNTKELLRLPTKNVLENAPEFHGQFERLTITEKTILIDMVLASLNPLRNKTITFVMSDYGNDPLKAIKRLQEIIASTLEVPKPAVVAALRKINPRLVIKPNLRLADITKDVINLSDPKVTAALFVKA